MKLNFELVEDEDELRKESAPERELEMEIINETINKYQKILLLRNGLSFSYISCF